MEMEARVERVKSIFTMLALFNSFSCMGVCPPRNWLIQVHQGLSSGHPGLIRLPSVTPVSNRRAEECQGWTASPVPAGRLRDLDVSTGVFAGLTTYANLPYVHCLSADPASVDKYDDGRLVRPLFVFEAPRHALFLWPCSGSTQRSDISPYRCISHVWSVSNWQCEYSVGEDVPDDCRFASGIDKNEWDSDECL